MIVILLEGYNYSLLLLDECLSNNGISDSIVLYKCFVFEPRHFSVYSLLSGYLCDRDNLFVWDESVQELVDVITLFVRCRSTTAAWHWFEPLTFRAWLPTVTWSTERTLFTLLRPRLFKHFIHNLSGEILNFFLLHGPAPLHKLLVLLLEALYRPYWPGLHLRCDIPFFLIIILCSRQLCSGPAITLV